MSKLLAKMNLAYDSAERVEKFRLLSKIISENKTSPGGRHEILL